MTSIQDSESRSGRLAERPLGIVLRLEMSESGLVRTGVDALGESAADKGAFKDYWNKLRVRDNSTVMLYHESVGFQQKHNNNFMRRTV